MAFTMTFGALGLLLILGIPISISLLFSGTLGYILTIGFQPGLTALAQGAYSDLNSFVIIAIPLYILMGQLMLKGEAGRDLFALAQRIVGRLPGGLAIAAILGGSGETNVLGSAKGGVSTNSDGSLEIPQAACDEAVHKLLGGDPPRRPACSP